MLPITALVGSRCLLTDRVTFHALPCCHDFAASSGPASLTIVIFRPAIVFVVRLIKCSRRKHKTFLDSLVTDGCVAILIMIR